MTKSIINALTGILIQEGRLALKGSLPIPEWQNEDDPRRTINLEQLLRMTSGLAFDESYSNPLSDVVVMLFKAHDAANYAARKPLVHTPGNRWYYSSGTTNIISRLIRSTFGNDYEAYLKFPGKSLFHRIGMYSALMETDLSGTFIGSSFSYATARDWARFGLLYLQEGLWMGERILPEGWVNFSVSPTENADHGTYGAHFWLRGRISTSLDVATEDPLAGMYFASGHDGQFVNILPKYDLVIVRLGLSKTYRDWNQNQFVLNILSAFKKFARLR
jgi:CubicO group peptidase (beta-lactamase class C family)